MADRCAHYILHWFVLLPPAISGGYAVCSYDVCDYNNHYGYYGHKQVQKS